MQSFLFILSALFWFTASNALPSGVFQDMKARTIVPVPDTCGNSSDAVPLFAISGGPVHDFVLDTSTVAIDILIPQGFTFAGVSARVFTTQETSTMPLYQVYLVDGTGDVTDHIYTMSETERDIELEVGYRDGGITGYIYPTQICGSIPYYRLDNSGATDHFYTVSEAERESTLAEGGWSDEGIVGYVLPPNCTE
ncbi:hypothetical protein MVEN_02645500 [Mycena venus]|uniref:DUF5648 domain-containing protein n=1 Tax=Mycena venus TaxID=2733690 RepID=A0A8H6TSB2_9AGAR|nr:hypothetical protein MVEN_02645500 [Mycena venus]